MSLSAIGAMLRERRLAAMRAEIDQSVDAPPSENQPGYDPNQFPLGGKSDADSWTSPGMAPGPELAAAVRPYAFPNSVPTMNVAMGDRPTGVWPRPGLAGPFPDVWEPWRQQAEQGIRGLIDAWQRLMRRSGGRGESTSGGGSGDECYDRWESEYARCDKFRPFGSPYRDACRARANDRLKLCRRNGDTPHPDEPPEYDWQDIPRDSPQR
jgi:hypothetical protein